MDEEQISKILNELYSIPQDIKYIMQDWIIIREKTVNEIIRDLEPFLNQE